MRRVHDDLKRALRIVCNSVVYYPDLPPPVCPGTDPSVRGYLKRLLTVTLDYEEQGADKTLQHLDDAFDYFNGDIFAEVLCHFCVVKFGVLCCANEQDSRRRCYNITSNLFFLHGNPFFNIQRWKKQMPGLRWWGRFLVFHNIGKQIYARVKDIEKAEIR